MATHRGILVIVSSPSGAGKTTLARRLLDEFPHVEFSVSYTTRKPRVNETDGVDYYFVDDDEFDAMIERDAFAEWAEVHGNRYGTSRDSVERALVEGRDVVFDVDWQGGRVLSDKWPDDSLKVFILPPDLDTLEARLRGRRTDADDVIRRRLRMAIEELTHFDEYTHLIVNDVLDEAYAVLRAIYLIRHYGSAPPSDLVHEFSAMRELVNGNRNSRAEDRARALIAEGKRRRARPET